MYRRRREIEGMQLALKVMEKQREKKKSKARKQEEEPEKPRHVPQEHMTSLKQRPRYWNWFWQS